MKEQRFRFRVITVIIIALLGISGVYGFYSVSTYGSRWFSSNKNTRYQSAKRTVVPGDIIDRQGVVLATTNADGERIYQSNIKSRSAIVHLMGDESGNVANGVETFQSSYLLGFETSLSERVLALLKGETRRGDNLTLTIDSALCAEIVNSFSSGKSTKGKSGAAVVMNYKTGEVLALVSLPVFDPVNITAADQENKMHPFWNRALQSTLPPGSTFKIITAISALQNLPDAKSMVFDCTGATKVLDQVITDYGKAQHGKVSLQRAFSVSCNNAFAQAALTLGDDALRKTAESFGFNSNFLFRDFVVENSIYPTTKRNAVEIAWSGAGQSQVAATPLHMCMVAAAIANDGIMMEPRLLARVQSPGGVVRLRYTQKQFRRVCEQDEARVVDGYMKNVVSEGTGTAAKVNGLTIAGKTGSAEGAIDGVNATHAWFVGYIDNDQLPYACAVLVEGGGTGGSVASPIAAQIFKYMKDHYAQ